MTTPVFATNVLSFLSPPFIWRVVQVELFNALCKALPQLKALRSLELEGLRKAFEMVSGMAHRPAAERTKRVE